MLDSRRLRAVLAVDAVGTALAGLLVYVRPGLLGTLFPDRMPSGGRRTRQAGLAVLALGVGKGLVYAAALGAARGRGRGPGGSPDADSDPPGTTAAD